MIKLSELPNDAVLTVKYSNSADITIMSKEDFLNSYQFLDSPVGECPPVTLGEKTVPSFDLWWVLENIGDGETYDGWNEAVYNDIKNRPETAAFLAMVKDVFEQNPTYWEGEPVEIDIILGQEATSATIGCKHGMQRHKNEIGEDEIYCELTARWMNVTLGDCLGNCESQS